MVRRSGCARDCICSLGRSSNWSAAALESAAHIRHHLCCGPHVPPQIHGRPPCDLGDYHEYESLGIAHGDLVAAQSIPAKPMRPALAYGSTEPGCLTLHHDLPLAHDRAGLELQEVHAAR